MYSKKTITFENLFAQEFAFQTKRQQDIARSFEGIFGTAAPFFFSSPGRTEICGNHTDHNNGKVLCAAVNYDMLAAVSPNSDFHIRLHSINHSSVDIDLNSIEPAVSERGNSASLVRGVAAYMQRGGYKVGGFNCYLESLIPAGGGLSSSAAFEVLIAFILSFIYNDDSLDHVTAAKIGQAAENNYFGKPSGLMDQIACAVGGFLSIDFEDSENPAVEKIPFDFNATNHTLCLVNTGGTHASLTDEYAAIRSEMGTCARVFDQTVLRKVDKNALLNNIPYIRQITQNDRTVLRAIHFLKENERVEKQKCALREGRFNDFLNLITLSGRSSFMYLQNVYVASEPKNQPLSLALAVSDMILDGRGAYRVHGGGFAGSIQAFIPNDLLENYILTMENVFGKGSCLSAQIRPVGTVRLI